MKPIKSAVTEVSVYREGDNFDFGESVTRIRLEDMGSGLVFSFKQDTDERGVQTIYLDVDEVDTVFEAAKALLSLSEVK